MTRAVLATIAAVVFVACVAVVGAGRTPAQSQDQQADLHRGEVIAAQGTANVPACAQCHAFNGTSDSSGAFPRLTGQSAPYLARQIRDFASSTRDSAVMSPIATQLSAEDIDDVSAYYAASVGPFPPLVGADPALIEKGKKIARIGDAFRNIQACNNCHGPDGTGFPPQIPYLAGQYAPYIELALHMWKEDFRKNSPDVMARLAKQLDDQDITALAAYYQQVRNAATADSAN